MLILFVGVMFGVQIAQGALSKVAGVIAQCGKEATSEGTHLRSGPSDCQKGCRLPRRDHDQ